MYFRFSLTSSRLPKTWVSVVYDGLGIFKDFWWIAVGPGASNYRFALYIPPLN
jgi:hypothetical protein